MYNSETWTLTKKMEEQLDSFHRRLLRIALNYRYPKIIKNSKLYTLTKEAPISETIRKRRLALFGHILRLDPETPAQKALDYYTVPQERPVGRPPTTWLSMISKDMKPTMKLYTIQDQDANQQEVPAEIERFGIRYNSLEGRNEA